MCNFLESAKDSHPPPHTNKLPVLFFLKSQAFSPYFFFFFVGIFQCAKNDFLYCIFLFRRAKMRHPPWQCRLPFSPLMHSHSGRELEELKEPLVADAHSHSHSLSLFRSLQQNFLRFSWLSRSASSELGKVFLYFPIPLKGTNEAEGSQMESMAHKLQFQICLHIYLSIFIDFNANCA